VHTPLDDEQTVREGEIPITLIPSVGPEPWDWIATKGRRADGGEAGRILIGDLRFPDAGLVWAREARGPVIYQVWVSPDMQHHGVGKALIDIYRYAVTDTVAIAGPFSPSGRALAKAVGATIIENPSPIQALKRSLMPPR
jgi:GNAT superfamily N-acetyltransferase